MKRQLFLQEESPGFDMGPPSAAWDNGAPQLQNVKGRPGKEGHVRNFPCL